MGVFVHCLLAFLLSVPFLTVVKASPCDPGWYEYNNNCYAYFDYRVTWNMAETQCRRYRGHLVSILSQEEAYVVYYIMYQYYYEYDNVWIGLHVVRQPDGASEFRWTDGSPYNFTSWEPGAPHPSNPPKDCVGLTRNSYFLLWTNMPCTTRKAYFCKYSL